MKIISLKYFLLFTGVLLLSGCSLLESDKPEVFEQKSDITKRELFKRMLAASDPTGAYRNTRSYIQRQEKELVLSEDKKDYFIIEVKYKAPNMFKITTLRNWQPVSGMIFNGNKAWRLDYVRRQYRQLSGVEFKRAKLLVELAQPGNIYSKIFPSIELTEVIEGAQQYYKLVCHARVPGISPITIFVGKSNFLTKRIELNISNQQGSHKYVSIMDKYALYENVMIASVSTVKYMGQTSKYRIIDYRLNVPLDNKEFTPPVWSD